MRLINKLAAPILAAALFGFLPACSTDSGQSMPPNAAMVSSGNKIITYAAPHDGMIYLRDDTSSQVVYSAAILKNQTAKFDPAMQQVMIGDTIANVPNSSDDHSWYFERASTPDQAAVPAADAPANAPGSDVQTIHVPVGVKIDVQTQPSAPGTN